MKIIRLKSENVMRLVAVDITPDGNMVIVGGKNKAGKSSVLNSIAMGLGGAAMCPQEPIRAGETDAKILLDLGDLIVTRKFHRERIERTPQGDNIDMPLVTFGDTTSTLVVTNKEGARYPSPQAVLDKLLGKLTFDPLAFTRMDPKAQDDALRKLVGLDVSAIEERRKEAFGQRAMLKKSHEIKVAQILAMPHHEGVHDEIPMAEISAEMLRAEGLRKAAEDAGRAVDKAFNIVTISNDAVGQAEKVLEEARRQVTIAESALHQMGINYDAALKNHEACKITHEAALVAVPDADAIRQRLTDAEAHNVKVRENLKYAERTADADVVATQIEEQDALVAAAVEEKRKLLEGVTFPVEGLGLGDGGVTFGGLPFAQASSSEQLRVSVAIGLALNPKLKVLLIRSGNLLDDDSLKLVAAQAEAAGAQVWMEYVTSNAEGVSVMIEEGKVVTE